MSGFYTKWVKVLNDWENHKTEAGWEYSYTQKIFVANFLVGYLSLVNFENGGYITAVERIH